RMEVPNGRMRRTQMVSSNQPSGKLCTEHWVLEDTLPRAMASTPGLCRSREPAIENSQLCGRQVLIEANAHAQAMTDIDDASGKFQFLAVVGQPHADQGLHRCGIQGVNVTTGSADIAGARAEASPGGNFSDFRGGNEWYARIAMLAFH